MLHLVSCRLHQERLGVLAATCLGMRNNAPVEHCVAEAFILHREIVLTMKPDFTLQAYLTTKITSIAR